MLSYISYIIILIYILRLVQFSRIVVKISLATVINYLVYISTCSSTNLVMSDIMFNLILAIILLYVVI